MARRHFGTHGLAEAAITRQLDEEEGERWWEMHRGNRAMTRVVARSRPLVAVNQRQCLNLQARA